MKKIIAFSLLFSFLYSLPPNPTVLSGTVTGQILDGGLTMEVTCSDRAVLRWNHLNLQDNETISFVLPVPSAIVLNQVINQSQMSGTILSTGQIFFSSPSGLTLLPSGYINAPSVLMTTLGISLSDFLSVSETTLTRTDKKAFITNFGTISAPLGRIYLIGPNMENIGTLSGRDVRMVSCTTARIKADATGIVYVNPTRGGGANVVSDLGTIEVMEVGGNDVQVSHLDANKNHFFGD